MVCCKRLICVVPCSSFGKNSLTIAVRAVSEAARSRYGMPSGVARRSVMALRFSDMARPISW